MRISDWSSDVCSSDLCPTRLDGLLSQLRYLLFQKFYLITRQGMRHFVHEKLAFVYEHRSKSLRHLWIEDFRLYDQNPGIILIIYAHPTQVIVPYLLHCRYRCLRSEEHCCRGRVFISW